jgi:hypothetical protein
MELFLQTFRQKSEELHCLVKATCVPIRIEKEDIEAHNDATICELCNEIYVFHHHHYRRDVTTFPNGRAVHIICNLCNIRIVKSAVVAISPNLEKRNGVLIIRGLQFHDLKKIQLVARSTNNIISLTLFNCRVIDSTQFHPNSFPELLNGLYTNTPAALTLLKNEFPDKPSLFVMRNILQPIITNSKDLEKLEFDNDTLVDYEDGQLTDTHRYTSRCMFLNLDHNSLGEYCLFFLKVKTMQHVYSHT